MAAAKSDYEHFSLPETMKTIPELNNFEQMLRTNIKYRENAIQILSGLDGQDMKHLVRLMLDRLVHDNLTCQFSFSGKRGKYTFSIYTGIFEVMLGKHVVILIEIYLSPDGLMFLLLMQKLVTEK